MVEKRKPIPVGEAVKRIMSFAKEGIQESVPIQQAYERNLAVDLVATHHVPPFDRSPYDGFAIRAEDSKDAGLTHPVTFEVIEEIGAGSVAKERIKPFQAIRIMTGAQLPEECDAVVMLELVKEMEQDGKNYITIKRAYQPGDNISFEGEDTKKGTVLVAKGTKINPGVQALLATFGYEAVKVVSKPVIGVFATGTELLEVKEELQPGKIRNSNSYMICAQIERSGGIPQYFGVLPDKLDYCFEKIRNSLDEVDMLITTGGVSVGDYDYLPEIYEKLGAKVLFNKVAMRPGSVTTVAELGGKLLFGLSGNPSACYVGYELFTRPVVKTLLFNKKPHLEKVQAFLDVNYPKPNPFTRFVRSRLSFLDGRLSVAPSGFDKSNAVSSLASANALMVLPGGTRGFEKGMLVDVLLLETENGSEYSWE
ncbi:gephyrin-like molybdotransferase Glp [Bacillus sp. DJP31]|uniref:molybdopterin molybdotransferase MoeA n=1 Tax=Bacillus sp. DJP31 TaxID=3409789 RepID=UPI003BB6269C